MKDLSLWVFLPSYWPAVMDCSGLPVLAVVLPLAPLRVPAFFLKTLKTVGEFALQSFDSNPSHRHKHSHQTDWDVLHRVFTVGYVGHATRVRLFIWVIVAAGHQAGTPASHDWKTKEKQRLYNWQEAANTGPTRAGFHHSHCVLKIKYLQSNRVSMRQPIKKHKQVLFWRILNRAT